MVGYLEPTIVKFSKREIEMIYNMSEKCTVVCTYMYGYCGDKEGWGTTYCPKWADGGE